jgi:N-acetylglucosamine-6-phosphate deacetylase
LKTGFVDLQVNGIAGADFASPGLTDGDVSRVSAHLYRRGVAGFCPTVITTSTEIYKHCLPVLAGHAHVPGEARILGIHVEGPCLSPKDGPRGVHPVDCIREPSIRLFEQLRAWADDRISIFTLAPELPGAVELIKHIREQSSTCVSLGHTTATADEIRSAVDAGASMATHLGNGLASMLHRHQNPIWPLLDEDRVSAMFITDGFHLPAEMIRVCLRAKGILHTIITSDVVHLASLQPGEYVFHGVDVLLEENGHLHRKGADQLAGSGCDMLECMNWLASLDILNEEELLAVGRTNALEVLGIMDEPRNDLVVFESGRFILK